MELQLRVVYLVKFECDVTVGAGEDRDDAISNIDIPEGGANGSVYCEGSFETVEVYNPNAEERSDRLV